MRGLAAVAWLDACLDWIAGLNPMCPALEDWTTVPVAVAAANLRRRGIAEEEIQALLAEAAWGEDREGARAVLIQILEGRIRVVG